MNPSGADGRNAGKNAMGALTLAVVETSICSLNWDKIADWRDGESLVTCHRRSTTGQHSLSEECGTLTVSIAAPQGTILAGGLDMPLQAYASNLFSVTS